MAIHFDLTCGHCDSTFTIDSSQDNYEDTAWLMAQRFMNGHSQCGYATPMAPIDLDHDDEDEDVTPGRNGPEQAD